jgi:membrane dipeptidase
MPPSPSAPRIVIDGLVYLCDGDPEPLATGGVTAANFTVSHMLAETAQAFDEMAAWIARVNAPGSRWRLVRKAADIEAAARDGHTGLIMGWQNTLPFGNRLERVHAFHAMGLRIAQLTYNEANLAAEGCMEDRGGGCGLTRFGRDLVRTMNEAGVAIDLSHCSEQTGRDAAAASTRPVLLTHANARAIHDRVRNKSDDVLKAVADTGGVIGVSLHGFMNWSGRPDEPPTLDGFVRHARHVAGVAGIEHVGIGTDFCAVQDDATAQAVLDMSRAKYERSGGEYARAFGNASAGRYPVEAPTPRQFPRMLEALERGGFTGREIDAIAGRNFLRAFADIWG